MALTKLRNNALSSDSKFTADQLDVGQLGGRRNLIINGGFDVWQRGTSFSSTGYTADRWKVTNPVNLVSRTNLQPDGFDGYGMFITPNGTSNPIIRQGIELPGAGKAGIFATGKVFTLSFWATAATGSDIRAISRFVDTPGILTNSVEHLHSSVGTAETTDVWQKYEVSFSIVGEPSPTNIALEVTLLSTNTVDPIRFANVQLELGSVATPFEHRSYGEELALCQRYYYNNFNNGQYPGQTGTVMSNGEICGLFTAASNDRYFVYGGLFPVEMRAAPSVSIYDRQGYINQVSRYNSSGTTLPIASIRTGSSRTKVALYLDNNAGVNDQLPQMFFYTADAEL